MRVRLVILLIAYNSFSTSELNIVFVNNPQEHTQTNGKETLSTNNIYNIQK